MLKVLYRSGYRDNRKHSGRDSKLAVSDRIRQCQYNTKFVKRHVAVASEAMSDHVDPFQPQTGKPWTYQY